MADIAFVNGGGVRANLNSGNVTKGNLINVNPFNNQLCYTSVSGQDLLDALELSASSLPESNGDFLQISEGLEFVIPVSYTHLNRSNRPFPLQAHRKTRFCGRTRKDQPMSASQQAGMLTYDLRSRGTRCV